MGLPSPPSLGLQGTNFHSRSGSGRNIRRRGEDAAGSPGDAAPFPSLPGGGGTCRQEAEVPSSISAPPLSSCKREEAVWELGAAGGGQRGRAGCHVCSVQSQQLFVVESLRLTCRGRREEKASPRFIPKSQGMQSPPSPGPHG